MRVKTEDMEQYRKKYYEENREKILNMGKEMVTCDVCGKEHQKRAKPNHDKSKFHQASLETKLLKDKIKKAALETKLLKSKIKVLKDGIN